MPQPIERSSIVNRNNSDNTKPGEYTKVIIDAKGRIISASLLGADDIPRISIDQVEGLREALMKNPSISSSVTTPTKQRFATKGTGIRINYDEDGLVMSAAELQVNDIPELPMSKISGLKNHMDTLATMYQSKSNVESTIETNVTPGEYCKVTIDALGRVTSANKVLSTHDLPSEFVSKMNTLESTVATAVTAGTFNAFQKSLMIQLEPILSISTTPGEYCKVSIDGNGNVTKGSELTKDDLPTLTTDDIDGLSSQLSQFVSMSDFTSIHNMIGRIADNNTFAKVNALEMSIDEKIKSLQNEVAALATKIASISAPISYDADDGLQSELSQFKSSLSSISGRLTTLESK